MQTKESKFVKLRDAIMAWCESGRPPVKGATVADKDAVWALANDLLRFHRAATFNSRAVKILEKCGFRTEATEVGWSIYND